MEIAEVRAKWIGIATYESNNYPDFPYRDSEAARWKANAAKRARENAKAGIDGRKREAKKSKADVAADEGGHDLRQVASGKGWFCMTCRARTKERRILSTTKCDKAGTKIWLGNGSRNAPVEINGFLPGWGSGQTESKGHNVARSGPIVWCTTCGCFAETRANGLNGECGGPPPTSQGSSGRRSQLHRLHANLHPVTLATLPAPVRSNGVLLAGEGGYSRLRDKKVEVDEHFIPYSPATFPTAQPSRHPLAARVKREMIHLRVLAKQNEDKRAIRRARHASCCDEAAALFDDFVNGKIDDEGVCNDDADSKDFWHNLHDYPTSTGSVMGRVLSPQHRHMHSRGCKPNRRDQLRLLISEGCNETHCTGGSC